MKRDIYNDIMMTLGRYVPINRNGVTEYPDERKLGWNDCYDSIVGREFAILQYYDKLTDEQKEVFDNYKGIFIHFEKEKEQDENPTFVRKYKVSLHLNMNDCFYFACADDEEVTIEELVFLQKLKDKYGNEHDLELAFVSIKRDQIPDASVIQQTFYGDREIVLKEMELINGN